MPIKRSILVDTNVRCGADASCGQGLKDNRCVQAGETRTTDIRLDVDPPKTQLGRLSHHVHRKYFLKENYITAMARKETETLQQITQKALSNVESASM